MNHLAEPPESSIVAKATETFISQPIPPFNFRMTAWFIELWVDLAMKQVGRGKGKIGSPVSRGFGLLFMRISGSRELHPENADREPRSIQKFFRLSNGTTARTFGFPCGTLKDNSRTKRSIYVLPDRKVFASSLIGRKQI